MEIFTTPDFIIIDDDLINNVICQEIIKSELPETKIIIYTDPQKALEYIVNVYSKPGANKAVLLLDIDMPALNGWDILEKMNDSSNQLKQQVKIFLLSSSITPEDKQRAADESLVCGYIEKPLTQVKLKAIFTEYLKLESRLLSN